MRFMALWTPDTPPAGPPDAEHMAALNKLVEEQRKAGVMILNGAFMKSTAGARVRHSRGDFKVQDGTAPFPDMGFAILETATKDEAIAAVKSFLALVGDGVCEIRQLMGPPQ